MHEVNHLLDVFLWNPIKLVHISSHLIWGAVWPRKLTDDMMSVIVWFLVLFRNVYIPWFPASKHCIWAPMYSFLPHRQTFSSTLRVLKTHMSPSKRADRQSMKWTGLEMNTSVNGQITCNTASPSVAKPSFERKGRQRFETPPPTRYPMWA